MATKESSSKPAPGEGAGAQEMEHQAGLFAGRNLLGLLPDAVPCILLVVNEHRQIVFANEQFMTLVAPPQRTTGVLGRRPGEVLECRHAFENESGCGTTEFCSICGASNAILASQRGHTEVSECRISRRNGEALELRVWTTPVTVEGAPFSIFAALDISHEKRRQALEHIFLHDISNVAYGLKWCVDFFQQRDPAHVEKFYDSVHRLCRELVDEIDGQRILVKAESGELVSNPEPIGSLRLLRDAVELYSRHPVSQNRHLQIDTQAQDVAVISDRTLLSRVLCNLVKNALEASRAGQTVTIGCTTPDNSVEFWVHNPGFIPREVQLQVFQRSFSTKGAGRGLGTYSVKLLTERYLQGRVSFISSPEQGTTFQVRYPRATKV